MFGKKKSAGPTEPPKPPSGSGGGGSGGDGGGSDGPPLPWAGWPDEIGCNFAGGHLVRNLQVPITIEGRVQAETLMTAAGAVAGWGAQRSLVANPLALAQAQKSGQLSIVTTADGRQMLYGDALNGMLTSSDPVTAQRCVWNYLAGTAIGHGMPEAELPDLAGMFAHVTKSIGGPREGFPSTPDAHQPLASAKQVLDRVLPLTIACLTGEVSEISKKNNFRAEPTSYQVVTSWTAAKILSQCCSVMPPRMALIIGMESAIYASKLMAQPKP